MNIIFFICSPNSFLTSTCQPHLSKEGNQINLIWISPPQDVHIVLVCQSWKIQPLQNIDLLHQKLQSSHIDNVPNLAPAHRPEFSK
ncbi:hypothetical protein RchiOBHm_Chr7g0218181 [Rosa chinensis]|uniref:Uncharacterized protein n=1 Tax=Rosa chinensis TaxID=74649 RepID=A0A2P6PC76_ROSCH|nr:hypothetical protein RchiOBHm_Chr7g0218181 [Rosa chinensis]